MKNELPQEVPLVEQLLAEGGIENLVDQHRPPKFMHERLNDKVFMLVPPEGTQFGDHTRTGLTGTNSIDHGVVEFISPQGESRGFASLHIVTPDQAEILMQRRDASLEKLENPFH